MSRITNNIMINDFYNNYKRTKENLNKYMNQLATGERFSQMSESPLDATKALKLKTRIKFNEQYASNVDRGIQWLKTTDEALDDTLKSLRKARDLAVKGVNGSLTAQDREKMGKEAEQIKNHLIQIGNTTFGGRYIFNGSKTKVKPYTDGGTETETDYQANGAIDNAKLNREVSQGVNVDINTSGVDVGADTDGNGVGGFKQIFADLQKLTNGLNNDNVPKIEQVIDNIDQHIEQTLNARASAGARQQRLELTQTRLEKREINYTEILSDTQDVDIPETIMKLKSEENVFRASLATGARVIQPNLVQFLS